MSAISELDAFLSTIESAEKLDVLPKAFRESYKYCWRIPISVDRQDFILLLLIDFAFPYSQPKVAIENGPKILDWPHLENNGMLCLLQEEETVNWKQPVSVTRHVLAKACQLIEQSLSGNFSTEFREEFISYWRLACVGGKHTAISLVEPSGPTRKISICQVDKEYFFGENDEELSNWIENRFGKKQNISISKTWLIWRKEPWVPAEYPHKSTDIFDLLMSTDDVDAETILDFMTNGYLLLVGSPTSNGNCFASVKHIPPKKQKQGPGRSGADPISKGFRKSISLDVVIRRATGSGSKIERISVERADHWWIHGRDQDHHAQALKNKSVCVVGLGSLGSEVMLMLARSGVGTLKLFDGQTVAWSNLSRHILGANSVGLYKTDACKNLLASQLPHINTTSNPKSISGRSNLDIKSMFESDLLLILTGDWLSYLLINEAWILAGRPNAMMVGWMEEHALTTHCVSISQDNDASCLCCGFNEMGRSSQKVFDFPSGSTLTIPACGGRFSPYGSVALAKASAFVAEQAIDVLGQVNQERYSVLIGSNNQIQQHKAKWRQDWLQYSGNARDGDLTVDRKWVKNDNCHFCADKNKE